MNNIFRVYWYIVIHKHAVRFIYCVKMVFNIKSIYVYQISIRLTMSASNCGTTLRLSCDPDLIYCPEQDKQ